MRSGSYARWLLTALVICGAAGPAFAESEYGVYQGFANFFKFAVVCLVALIVIVVLLVRSSIKRRRAREAAQHEADARNRPW